MVLLQKGKGADIARCLRPRIPNSLRPSRCRVSVKLTTGAAVLFAITSSACDHVVEEELGHGRGKAGADTAGSWCSSHAAYSAGSRACAGKIIESRIVVDSPILGVGLAYPFIFPI
jgi:hypothetical protein